MKYRRPRRRGGTAGPFTGIFIVSLFRARARARAGNALRRELSEYLVSPSAIATPFVRPVLLSPARFSRFILSSSTRKIASCYDASLKLFIKERERQGKRGIGKMTASRTTEEEGGKDEEVEEDEGEGGEKEAGCSRSAARSNRETAGNSLRPLRGSPSSRPPPALSLFLRASYFSFYSFRCRCETTGGSLSYGVLAPSLSPSFLFLIVWRKVLSLNHRPPRLQSSSFSYLLLSIRLVVATRLNGSLISRGSAE